MIGTYGRTYSSITCPVYRYSFAFSSSSFLFHQQSKYYSRCRRIASGKGANFGIGNMPEELQTLAATVTTTTTIHLAWMTVIGKAWCLPSRRRAHAHSRIASARHVASRVSPPSLAQFARSSRVLEHPLIWSFPLPCVQRQSPTSRKHRE